MGSREPFNVLPPSKSSSRSGGSLRSGSSRASGASNRSRRNHRYPSLHLPDFDELVRDEAVSASNAKNMGKKSKRKMEKAWRNKDDMTEPHSDWESPRVKVNPSECPVTEGRWHRGSDRLSDRRSRRGNSCKKE